ncbi:putative secreted protein with PEP-CTERM sorting signal [Halospina denitrificans]|uniref:Putative secreted protein with PEP-CTERM sorting signal n=1 Tax=Halospina denitrificans TaxID=332522 RepID=A0A4R7JMX2_9GAMM|nr:THxN family PEP-CTERM protein [Halospina denitrificans]TDT39461.1 putative secreted protein with PEP-CTERM sorting signal [Halospina denitrificans]
MKTSVKKTLLSTLIMPVALGAQFASADMITEWGYDVESVFSNAVETPGETPTLNQPDDRTLEWGLSDDKSSVSITDVDSPDGLITNGDSVMGGTFTHNNFTQPVSGAALESFDLGSTLTLNQVSPSGDAVKTRSRTFKTSFEETLNAGSCFAASSTPKCDDIFTIGNIDMLNFEQVNGVYKFVSDEFEIDDYSYTVFTELDGLGPLDNDACGLAGAANGCVGLFTPESASSDFQTRFSITAEKVSVPEPGTLALFGLGLAGLGLGSRRKAAKA